MNFAGFPPPGFSQTDRITRNTDTGNFDIGNPANPANPMNPANPANPMNPANLAGLVFEATQPGGLPNAAFDLFNNLDLGPIGDAVLDFTQSLVEGHDPLASGAQLVDDAGVLPDNFSAQDVSRGVLSLVNGDIADGASSIFDGLPFSNPFG